MPYLGCFEDKNARDLTALNWNSGPAECFRLAREKKYEFVALQYGGQCFAGNSVGRYGDRSDSECSTPCKQEKGMKCGAGWRNSVWFTGTLTFEKHTNYCVTAGGKDLTQTK